MSQEPEVKPENWWSGKRSWWWWLLVAPLIWIAIQMVGFVAGEVSRQAVNNVMRPSVEQQVQQVAREMREQYPLPRMVNANTRWDAVTASGRTVIYDYTLIGVPFDTSARSALRDGYCNQMRPMVEQGVSAEWRYYSTSGRLLASVQARPSDCS
jgi:hypothetical protein